MDFKVMSAAFLAIFLAELADKTQLVGISLTLKTAKPLSVFFGSVAAYALITAVSVWIGASLGRYINPVYLRYGGAFLFIMMGFLILFDRL